MARYFELGRPDRYADRLASAESAFARALALNPDLTVAHNLYTALEMERGRARGAMVRLLERAKTRGGADPELFAGLVTACRYCGLLEASVAAHEQGRRLDPAIPSSVSFTLWAAGDYAAAVERASGLSEFTVHVQCLVLLGRRDEALEVLKRHSTNVAFARVPLLIDLLQLVQMIAEGGRDKEVVALAPRFDMVRAVDWDPEGVFRMGLFLAKARCMAIQKSLHRASRPVGLKTFSRNWNIRSDYMTSLAAGSAASI